MTISEAIARVQSLKPNQYGTKDLVQWLSDLDGKMYAEIVSWHENSDAIAHGPYSDVTDMDTILMAPDPYSDVYIKWLFAQIDYHNAEFTRYNNSMIMYNAALSAYADSYNRNHMPKQTPFTF